MKMGVRNEKSNINFIFCVFLISCGPKPEKVVARFIDNIKDKKDKRSK